jgi:hypothetical protein
MKQIELDELEEIEMAMEHYEADLRANAKDVRREIARLEDDLNKDAERVYQFIEIAWSDIKSLLKKRGLI